ncbi:MAG: stalk domain-containing protein [Oscillospiraceae bacterium]
MKKKLSRKLRCVVIALALTAALAGTAVAAGTVVTKTIEANYMDIQIVVDGVAVTPKDANGKVVEPFISESTTYLPVRAIGEALGKQVTWDGETKTVYIGQVPGTQESWMTKLPPYQVNSASRVYDGTDPKAFYTVGGVTKTEGITLCDNKGGTSNGRDPYVAFAQWNTNYQYESVTFTIAHCGDVNYNGTLTIYLDGNYVAEYDLKWDGGPRTITVPLNYAANLKLELEGYEILAGGSKGNLMTDFAIYDISFAE